MKLKRFISIATATILTAISLTACTSQDKAAVTETANTFMAIVASQSDEDINKYATSEVANGDFVKLFDADSLVDIFVTESTAAELSDEAKAEVDEFCKLFAGMIKSYSVSSATINKDGTATAIATIKTAFPIDIINSEESSAKIDAAIEEYNETNAEAITALYEEGDEVATAKIYNDMLTLILDIYEDEIANSEEMTYAIALDLEKNSETDTWIVTQITDYDTSASSSGK
nr:hypothetical protein [uncultured Butyrivibrio sp.]